MGDESVEKYQCSKPHINIATIGHKSHGKTTLTAAILKVLAHKGQASQKSYDKTMSMVTGDAISSLNQCNVFHVEYETDARHYAHFDCAGDPKFIKSVISTAAMVDGAILVVDVSKGIMAQTHEHLRIFRFFGVNNFIIFLNKNEGIDQDQLELLELDLRMFLNSLGYSGDSCSVISGSASRALAEPTDETVIGAMGQLLHAMDTNIQEVERRIDAPFLMSIANVHSMAERGTVVTGVVERGVAKVGDEVELVGYKPTVRTVIASIQTFGKQMDEGKSGDYIGLLLRDLVRNDIRRGQVVTCLGTLKGHTEFEAEVYVLRKEEGGRHTPFVKNYQPQVYLKTGSGTATVTPPESFEKVMPGDNARLTLKLSKEIVIHECDRILIRDNSKIVAAGVVTRIIQ